MDNPESRLELGSRPEPNSYVEDEGLDLRDVADALEDVSEEVNDRPPISRKDVDRERAPHGRTCKHAVCINIERMRLAKSVSIAFLSERECRHLDMYNARSVGPLARSHERIYKTKMETCMLLAKHRKGQHRGSYSVPSGKMDPVDGGCWINTVRRELNEELKINLSAEQFFSTFRDGRGGVNVIKCGGTPLFVAFYSDINIAVMNVQLKLVADDPSVADCQKEIERVEWFSIATGAMPNDNRHSVSEYGLRAMSTVHYCRALSRGVAM